MASLIEKALNIPQRPTWAEIDLNNLAANFNQIKQRVGSAAKVMAVVKANAYGHGAVQCARRLVKEGAEWFGVALPEEGIELRATGIGQPILVLGGFWEGQAQVCLQQRLTPVVYRLDMLAAMDQVARDAGLSRARRDAANQGRTMTQAGWGSLQQLLLLRYAELKKRLTAIRKLFFCVRLIILPVIRFTGRTSKLFCKIFSDWLSLTKLISIFRGLKLFLLRLKIIPTWL